jgi:SAM-dependent methyltransferase
MLELQRIASWAGPRLAPAIALAYRGNRIECPVCGGRFRRLRPFGRTRRVNALCPRCGALERTRSLWLYLSTETELTREHARVLHVAPEPSVDSRLRRLTNLDYVTGDLERSDVDVAMDITSMPFDAESFDAVICSHVLEHVPDDRLALREILRVLRPGGQAVLMIPLDPSRASTLEDPTVTDPAERERRFNQRDHVRIYGQDFEDRLLEAGFEFGRIDLPARLGHELAERHALVERTETGAPNPFRSDIFACRKPR